MSHSQYAAARARTILAMSPEIGVGVLSQTRRLNRHAVDQDGDVYFVPPPDGPLAAALTTTSYGPVEVRLVAYDIAPVPMPDRMRGRVALAGRLSGLSGDCPTSLLDHLGVDRAAQSPQGRWPVLTLVPERVAVSGGYCAEATKPDLGPEQGPDQLLDLVPVDLSTYRAAGVDPLAECERDWLPHLHRDHQDALRLLWSWQRGGPEPDLVVPLAMDARGLVLRASGDVRAADVRLDFPQRARCGCEATEMVTALLQQATTLTRRQ